ncbi:MAG TPA: hypothetical protein VK470_05030 [Bacteroidota bacterium]|nr:hypothetical protein [Bacteroidota bacterium]
MNKLFASALLVFCLSSSGRSQNYFSTLQTGSANRTDSTIVFTSPRKENPAPAATPEEQNNAWGVDVMLSGNGFGLGAFYRHEYSRDLSGTISFAITDSKDDAEVEYVDWYGQTYVPNKINRFLMMPLYFGTQYRLFADDITDTFRPYVNAGVGPTLILSSPYEREYFNALHYARAHYTAGGYVGFGAYFGSEKSSLMGVNFRYYYIPVAGGIDSMLDPSRGTITKKNDFGGFFITINIGSIY